MQPRADLPQLLAAYLQTLLGKAVYLRAMRRFSSGFSWITWSFAIDPPGSEGETRFILRLGPPDGLFAPYSAAPQYFVLKALEGSQIPVPRGYAWSDDASILGMPFFISQHVDGDTPIPWGGPAMTDEKRHGLGAQFTDALAHLHVVPWHHTGLAPFGEGVTVHNAARLQLDAWMRNYERWALHPYPMIHHALRWLRANLPTAPRVSIVHGDYRLGNFLEAEGRIEEAHFRRRAGRVTEQMARAQQLGRYAGWIEVEGHRIELHGAHWLGQRDHSWGIRAEMRTDESHPPLTLYPPFLYAWTTAQFGHRGLHVFFKERAPGQKIYVSGEEVLPPGSRADPGRILDDVTHDIVFAEDPHGQTVASARFDLSFADGTTRPITLRTLPARYFLKGGLYGGLNGWFQGDDRGELHVAHDIWDLDDPAIRKLARTLADHAIELRDGDDVGYGIMEYGVGKGYALYGSVQEHPAI